MRMPNRYDVDHLSGPDPITLPGGNYRYAYNGMEQDNEVTNNIGTSYTTEFRQYDPRLARWKSLDPLMHQFPWMSPYVAFDNNPVYFTDIYGLESEPPGGDPNATPSEPTCGYICYDETTDKMLQYKGDGEWGDHSYGDQYKDKIHHSVRKDMYFDNLGYNQTLNFNEVIIRPKKPIATATKSATQGQNWNPETYFEDNFIPTLMKHEGGYQAMSADRGNYDNGNKKTGRLIGTKYGVSAPVLKEYLKRRITVSDMKNLSKETAIDIYKSRYWNKPKISQINDKDVAEQLADFYVNAEGNAAKSMQRALNALGENVSVDGVIGSQTIKAINNVDAKLLHAELKSQRITFYTRIAVGGNAKFKRGWLRRANSFKYGD